MRKITYAFIAALLVALAGCSYNVKPISEVKFYPKPSQEEARAKIDNFLSSHLKDPYSAKVDCSEVSDEAYVWPGVGFDTQ